MNAKLASIFLVAFVALPVLSEPLRAPFDELVEVAEEVLIAVNTVIKNLIEESSQELQTAIHSLDTLKEKAVREATKAVEKEIKVLDKWLEELKNKTDGDTSKTVIKCIEAAEPQILTIEEQAVNSTAACADVAIDKVLNDTLEILETLYLVNEDINKEEQHLESCKGLLIPFDCIKGVISSVVDLALSAPEKVRKEVEKAREDFKNLGPTLEKCVSNASKAAEDGAAQVMLNITTCIDKN